MCGERGPLAAGVGRIDSTAVPVTDALQAARDALEEALSLGCAKPLSQSARERSCSSRPRPVPHAGARLLAARQQALDDHEVDARYGMRTPAAGFPGVQRAYREAALSLSYSSSSRPVVSLADLSSLECALISANATTRAVIASKGDSLRGLSNDELTQTIDTVRAFAAADLNVARAAAAMYVHPNTVRYRLARITATTGHDPRTFAGLAAELICVLETIESRAG